MVPSSTTTCANRIHRLHDEYFDLHGWDRETGYPRCETLLDLGLASVAENLAKIGKLR